LGLWTLDWQFSKIKDAVLTLDSENFIFGYFILNPFLKIQNWEFFNFQNLEPEVITKDKEPPNTSIDRPKIIHN
jgi:hypothetical protein